MKLKFIIAFTLVIVASRGNSQVIVADHSIVERYSAIPRYYIDKVKQMWVSIAGESHSEAYRVGCELLETIDSRFQVNVKESGTPEPYTSSYLRISRATWGDYNYSTGWQYSYGEEDWFTNSTAVQRTRNGLLYCHQNGPALSVLGFGWCYDMTATNEPGGQYDPVYNVRWAGETESGPQGSLRWGLDAADQALTGNSVSVDTYLEATLGYINFCEENNIPTSILFTTGPIDNYGTYYLAEGESGYQQFLKTSRIREYVNSLEKAFLFDYADILAYNNNGVMNITTWIDNASLNHTFPIIADENMEGGYVAHIGNNGALRLAKALWWLLARIAGWDGISTNIVPVSSVTITAPQSQTLIDADNGYLQLTASVLPVNATNTTVSWTLVSGKNLASVSGNGLITAKSDGIVTVKALAKDGSGSEDTYVITITGQSTLGTSTNPYNGQVLSGRTYWTPDVSPVFVSGDLTIGSASIPCKLNVDPGTVIVFTEPEADLIITGLGQLVANGRPESPVLFTADNDNDGNYGEPGESRGHLAFISETGGNASVISHCIIERGAKNVSGTGEGSEGGGIYISGSSPAIKSVIIRNNSASMGGGVYSENSATNFMNCIFYNNQAIDGGGVFLGTGSESKLINSVVSNNSAPASGCNITLDNGNQGTGPVIINSIIWGTDISVAINYGASRVAATSDFLNCAIQGYIGGYSDCIHLSSENNNTNGPRFTDPEMGDYSVSFQSPCRDKGAAPVIANPYDFLLRRRVGPNDIGAYEVQYSRWKGDGLITSWSDTSNWENGFSQDFTGTTGDIVIPESGDEQKLADIQGTVSIGSGKSFVLEPGARASLADLSNSGVFKLMSDTDRVFSIRLGAYARNPGGTEEIQLSLRGRERSGINKWHYISSPVNYLPVVVFSPFPTQNLAQFIEALPSESNRGLVEGWVAYDGYSYADGKIPVPPLYTFSELTPGKGYNYFFSSNYLYTFSGLPNTTDVTIPLSFTGNPGSVISGFNLVGNPFLSGIDWDAVTEFDYPSNTSKAIYFTRDNYTCTYVDKVGTFGSTGIIPPMQGFFIKANDLPDRPLVIPVRAQVNNGIHPRYKSETTLTLLKIEVTSGKLIDETIIRFNSKSTIGRDNDYDAIKAGFSVSGLSVWSTLNGEKYVINSLPPPREKFEIPVSVHSDKQATVSLAIREKRNLDGYAIILRDIVTGNQIDLNNGGVVTAEVQSGETNNRFVLSVMMGNTGIDEVTGMNGRLTAYYMNSGVYILAGLPVTGVEGEFVIYDINGRALASGKMLDINDQQILDVALGNGLYIVEFKAKGFRKTGKLAVY